MVVGRYRGPDGSLSVVSSYDIFEFEHNTLVTITSYAVEPAPKPGWLARACRDRTRSWARFRAATTSSDSISGNVVSGRNSSTTIALATSPAAAPPIPSATTKTGAGRCALPTNV